jgi:hypothetical protein
MFLQRPKKEDFLLQKDFRVDVANEGFTNTEIKALVGPRPSNAAKGLDPTFHLVGE